VVGDLECGRGGLDSALSLPGSGGEENPTEASGDGDVFGGDNGAKRERAGCEFLRWDPGFDLERKASEDR
jgi:hypothetical protein